MLIVTFALNDNVVCAPHVGFEDYYNEAWFDDFAKEAILDIDGFTITNPPLRITSSELGLVAPYYLSTDSKTVLAVRNRPNWICNGSFCRESTFKWFIKACEDREQKVFFWHRVRPEGCEEMDFEIKFDATGEIARSVEEYDRILQRLSEEKRIPV